ncbi:hypothetical protein BLNAU_8584 [Blattamonas nauphoetae]|uniref:Uncharacterized protein n=1 Tax=Blattamonas nauphoetae TaxID=2049346 RepID=A0ABQ9XYI4_9EUKA|nr:hypothetical protein BLNAU_8584 [Blattamonas nauphoetae]
MVVPCLYVLGMLLERRTLNTTPFLPALPSLALAVDIFLLNTHIEVFEIISKTTAASPSPFSLSTITIHSLLFAIPSILLHSVIEFPRLPYLVDFDSCRQRDRQTGQ